MALCWKYGIYPSWSTGIQEMPAWTLPPALRPVFQRIFILNWDISMVGQSEWFWEWWFHNLLQDIPLFSPHHPSGQKLLFDTWNSLLLKSQPISCYPHVDSSENHMISSTVYLVHYDAQSQSLLILYLNDLFLQLSTPLIGKAPVRYHGGPQLWDAKNLVKETETPGKG